MIIKLLILIILIIIFLNKESFGDSREVLGNLTNGDSSFEWVVYDNNIKNKHVQNLIHQAKLLNFGITVVGQGDKWTGWYGRTMKYKEYINTLDPETFVLLTDARDVVLNNDYNSFIIKAKEYYYYNSERIIFNVDSDCNINKKTPNAKSNKAKTSNYIQGEYKPFMEKRARELGINHRYVYLNFGMQFGKAKDFLKLFELMNIQPGDDDQVLALKLFFENPDLFFLDYNQELLGTALPAFIRSNCVFKYSGKFFTNTVTNTQPSLIHTDAKNWHCYRYLLSKLLPNAEYLKLSFYDKILNWLQSIIHKKE
jgi:hypothetical protein